MGFKRHRRLRVLCVAVASPDQVRGRLFALPNMLCAVRARDFAPHPRGRICSGPLFLKSHRFLGFSTGEKVDVSPIVRQMSPRATGTRG